MAYTVLFDKEIYIKRAEFASGDKVFVNYSTAIASKDYNDRTVKCYLPLKFPKDIDVPNGSKIKVLDAIIGFNPYAKNGAKYPYIYIKNYELIEMGKTPEEDGSAFLDSDDYSFV